MSKMFKLNNVTGTITIPNSLILDRIPEKMGNRWDDVLKTLDINLRRDIGRNLYIRATYRIPSIVMRRQGHLMVSDNIRINADVMVNNVPVPAVLTGRFSTDMKSFSFDGVINLNEDATNNLIRNMISRIISSNSICTGLSRCLDGCNRPPHRRYNCSSFEKLFDPACNGVSYTACATACRLKHSVQSTACDTINGLLPVIMPLIIDRFKSMYPNVELYRHEIKHRAGSVRIGKIGTIDMPCNGIPMDIDGDSFKAKICYSLDTGTITGKTYIESNGIKFYGNILRGDDSITISDATIDAGSMVTSLRFITDYLTVGSIEMSESVVRGLGLQPVLGVDVLDLIEKESGG